MMRPSLTQLFSPALGAVLLLVSCTGASLPRVALAPVLPVRETQPVVLRDDELAGKLRAAIADGRPSATKPTEAFILLLQKRLNLRHWSHTVRIQDERGRCTWEIHFQPSSKNQGLLEWAPSDFGRIIPASAMDLSLYHRIAGGAGAGTPVVLPFEDISRLREGRGHRPANAIYLPATVVLTLEQQGKAGKPSRVICRFINTSDHRSFNAHGRNIPLAWNLTAPLAANLENRYVRSNALSGLLRPDKRQDDQGVFGVNVFDPKRIPVVFVHGLKSDPSTWRNAVNEIYASPELHRRYQPLFFLYPSGHSIPSSAARLRERLQQFRERWDPRHTSRAFDQMVIVGHSMGGLITRMQVIDSGQSLWNAFFTRPPAQIPWLTQATRREVETGLIFRPQPCVKRVVFIAAPHRGSKIADNKIVQAAVRLIHLPGELAGMAHEILQHDSSLLNPSLLDYHLMGLGGVSMLSPGHPFFGALESLEIRVPCHSIIACRDISRPLDQRTDGIVPYSSSHIDAAESETLIVGGHSCTRSKDCISELLRILKKHVSG